jgi:hypothetical protein
MLQNAILRRFELHNAMHFEFFRCLTTVNAHISSVVSQVASNLPILTDPHFALRSYDEEKRWAAAPRIFSGRKMYWCANSDYKMLLLDRDTARASVCRPN